MQIFHTSPDEITSINKFGMLGECLCFSVDIYKMAARKVIVYSLDIDEQDIIDASSLFYRDDDAKLDGIVQDVMELADCDREEAEELISQRSSYSDDAEIDWRIQGYAGEAAKALGYSAARAEDEQGTVYIVPMFERVPHLIKHAGILHEIFDYIVISNADWCLLKHAQHNSF